MASNPVLGDTTPRRLGLSAFMRQRLGPCFPVHMSACLPFLKKSKQHLATPEPDQLHVVPPRTTGDAATEGEGRLNPSICQNAPVAAQTPINPSVHQETKISEISAAKAGKEAAGRGIQSTHSSPTVIPASATLPDISLDASHQQAITEEQMQLQLRELQRSIAKWNKIQQHANR
ncbi:hypothetical protein cyc_05878 [Cyclospora cayetanensis]|uniref:Uncharacterized protein n=1 Tax=Cyclospora cayetanensis TaxID=88456 RepID=A0A1D3DAJ8_9EIME|nr:hypothetical protein cyc_05878 [Cyclospora cayetanensis]